MTGESPVAANPRGAAPALQLQEEIRHVVGTSLTHFADGSRLHQRCRDMQAHRPRDMRLLWLAARLSEADAILGEQLAKVLLPPRRKAKRKRPQNVDGELNSCSLNFCTPECR